MFWYVISVDTKNDITKTTKLISLQFLCEIITNHVQSGTELYRCLLLHDTISDEIVPDIDVARPIATLSFAIILQFNGTLIILLDNLIMDVVSILFQ